VTPEDFGLTRSPKGAIAGGDAAANAAVLEKILSGEAHPARDAIILNAAAALVVALELEPRAAAARAAEAIANGAATRTLDKWRIAAQARKAT
jgi:anthranilate phosphoribosyltransferase